MLLKDDKSFPFVKLSMADDFPRISVTRRVRDDGARYLGPFTDVKNLRRTLRELRRGYDRSKHTTPLAYIYYGHPKLRMTL